MRPLAVFILLSAAMSCVQSKRMADGKHWTAQNLNVATRESYCYQDSGKNCRQYGRLYTWDSGRFACQSLGNGWRLPTADEWQQLAKLYDDGYRTLLTGGSSGFNARLGGGRSQEGQYDRLEAHGFYWTATETDPTNAVFYNFAHGQRSSFVKLKARSQEPSPSAVSATSNTRHSYKAGAIFG
jgi:uncharacterized protein (TIGR02145 family)